MIISEINIKKFGFLINVDIVCGVDGYFAAILYLNNEKIEATKYKKNKYISFHISKSGIYCVAVFFKINDLKDRKTSKSLKVYLIDIESKINALTYQKNKESVDSYEQVISLLEDKFSTTKDVNALLELCRVEKRMWSGITEIMRRSAQLAFKEKPSQQSIYWYCESFLRNKNVREALIFLDDIFKSINDINLLYIKKIYLSSLNHKLGKLNLFEVFLKEYRDSGVNFNYFKEQELLWLDKPQVAMLPEKFDWAGGEVYFDLKNNIRKSSEIKYVFSVSCDAVYFKRFKNFFVGSWRLTCSLSSVLHIVIVNPDSETFSIADGLGDGVYVSYFRTDHYNNLAPISATARFVYLERLLDHFKLPVVVCDFDIVINKNIDALIFDLVRRKVDHLARVIGAVHPWQRYTAGFNVFNFSKPAIYAAKLMRSMAVKDFEDNVKKPYVDQSILEGSIRFAGKQKKYKIEFADGDMLMQTFKIPTGSYQSKIDALSCSLNILHTVEGGGAKDINKPVKLLPWSVLLKISEGIWVASIVGYSGNGHAEFAFYLMRGKERVAMQWYTSEPSTHFPPPAISGSYRAIGFVRSESSPSPEFLQSLTIDIDE